MLCPSVVVFERECLWVVFGAVLCGSLFLPDKRQI